MAPAREPRHVRNHHHQKLLIYVVYHGLWSQSGKAGRHPLTAGGSTTALSNRQLLNAASVGLAINPATFRFVWALVPCRIRSSLLKTRISNKPFTIYVK